MLSGCQLSVWEKVSERAGRSTQRKSYLLLHFAFCPVLEMHLAQKVSGCDWWLRNYVGPLSYPQGYVSAQQKCKPIIVENWALGHKTIYVYYSLWSKQARGRVWFERGNNWKYQFVSSTKIDWTLKHSGHWTKLSRKAQSSRMVLAD